MSKIRWLGEHQQLDVTVALSSLLTHCNNALNLRWNITLLQLKSALESSVSLSMQVREAIKKENLLVFRDNNRQFWRFPDNSACYSMYYYLDE